MKNAAFNRTIFCALIFIGFLQQEVLGQQFMMQGWYWDYPKTAQGYVWADTLDLKLGLLDSAGFTHIWLPPHTVAASGQNSNGYDPKDLYVGTQTTGFAPRANLDNLLSDMNALDIRPVADMVFNHRDGGRAEINPEVENYIESFNWTKADNGDNPYPSDRFRCILPLVGSSGNGAGDYYFKISSASGHSRFYNKPYKVYMQTNTVGYQNQPAVSEVEPNGGGDCGQGNNAISLGVDFNAAVDASGCTVDELHLNLKATDFNASGDTLQIYLSNLNGDYSDHRIYGLWSGSLNANIVDQIKYQTYTDFTAMPSGMGAMNWQCFKPNGTPTGLKGDWDQMYFFYDYDQYSTCARDALFDWALWTCQNMNFKGFRLDAVKHFPPDFVGDMLDYLYDNGVTLDLIVGEWYSTNTSELSGWVNDVLAAMNPATKAAMTPKIFDFSLRESLRQSCDQFGYDVRNVFNAGLANNGLSGFNVVTFANNHDFRDSSGFASQIKNDVILPYAYILTNNQLGVPCVFYPDYFGYYKNGGSGPYVPGHKKKIDQLIKIHKKYIYGAAGIDYLSAVGSGYSATYTTGYPNTSLIYQLTDIPTGKDVIVAINFAGEDLNVTQNIDMTNVPANSKFTDVSKNSIGPDTITLSGSELTLKVPARSYAVWVEGEVKQIPLPINFIAFDAIKSGEEVQIKGILTTTKNLQSIEIEKSEQGTNFHTLVKLDVNAVDLSNTLSFIDKNPYRVNFYRLRAEDKSGIVSYSNIRRVNFSGSDLQLVQNPVSDRLILSGDLPVEYQASIFDMQGNRIWSKKNFTSNPIPVDFLPSGAYILTVTNKEVNEQFMFLKQ